MDSRTYTYEFPGKLRSGAYSVGCSNTSLIEDDGIQLLDRYRER